MDELIRFIQKEKHQKLLEIFMILDEISKKEDILSFEYKKPFLMVKIKPNEYIRVKIKEDKKWNWLIY